MVISHFLLFALPLSAREASYKNVLITTGSAGITVRLPLTDVTGPVRLKRRAEGGYGMAISPLSTKLQADDYLEWQVAYDTSDPTDLNVVPEIVFQRDSRTKHGCELSKIIADALRLGLLKMDDLRELQAFLTAHEKDGLEENETIKLTADPERPTAPGGFTRLVQAVPMLTRSTTAGTVEIQFKQKQRAVGYQAMVYLCVPVSKLTDNSGKQALDRAAQSKETLTFAVTRDNLPLFLDAVRAFALASREHNSDLQKILAALVK